MNKSWFISYLTNMCGRVINNEEIGVIEHQLSLLEKAEAVKVQCGPINDILSALQQNKFIDAIKGYRALTGVGLKEAKDAIEAYRPATPNDPRQGKPEYRCDLLEIQRNSVDDNRLRVKLRFDERINNMDYNAGEIIVTSSVKLIDFDKGYAITQNSVYRWK